MHIKLLEITTVDFDVIGQWLIRFSVSVRYCRKSGSIVHKLFIDFKNAYDSDDDGGSKYLWNVGQILVDYTTKYTRICLLYKYGLFFAVSRLNEVERKSVHLLLSWKRTEKKFYYRVLYFVMHVTKIKTLREVCAFRRSSIWEIDCVQHRHHILCCDFLFYLCSLPFLWALVFVPLININTNICHYNHFHCL
jgi:hypothetical protein